MYFGNSGKSSHQIDVNSYFLAPKRHDKASVFSSLEETKALRDSIGYGIIVELTLNEKELDL